MTVSNKVLAPIVNAFLLLDVAIITSLILAGRDPVAALGAAVGLALTFSAINTTPYVFVAFQHSALFLSFPFVFFLIYREFPGGSPDYSLLDASLALHYLGFGMFAAGIRLGGGLLQPLGFNPSQLPLKILFYIVLVLFAADWVVRIGNNMVGGGLAQIVNEIVKFRYVFLVLLVFGALAARRAANYVLIASLFILLPQSTSQMSGFAGVPMLIAYSVLSFVFLSGGATLSTGEVLRALKICAIAVAVLLAFGLVWTGGLKPAWRAAVSSGQVSEATTERLATFISYFRASVASFDLKDALDAMAARTSSGMFFTALTLDRVPTLTPHEWGAHTMTALHHALTPRILFPNKPVLASDSELVRLYTGLEVAGEESGASIGLGYIAELYVDYGSIGAGAACFLFGIYLGWLFKLWQRFCRIPALMHSAALIVAWSSLNVADASLVKLFGSITMQGVLFLLLLMLIQRFSAMQSFGRPRPRGSSRVVQRQAFPAFKAPVTNAE